MWWNLRKSYQSLPQAEGKPLENASSWTLTSHRWPRSTIILGLTNVVTLLAFLAAVRKPSSTVFRSQCTQDLSTPSPALDAVQYEAPRHYNAEFRQTNKWRGPPGNHSNAIDMAWHEIELGAGGIRVTEEELKRLDMTDSPDLPFHKIPEEHGGGYLAMLEVFHLLHCLNSLRMGLFYNYDHYKYLDEGVHDENIYSHFDHCIDMLRMNLMCYADVTPALFVDPLSNPRRRDALPNWSSMHTCRNFDAILDWNKHGPRSVRWRDAGTNPSWNPDVEDADPPFPPEGHGDGDHHH
ncbi:Cyclochlorotine biosynthesis protein O [Colletotrichum spinosum]|uniref:Cyclochlorotine biosynthesis protein O n=1 Tax=Colletotrichum spinosum TaxID=1347390 RepID=A0A4R8Q8E4_9PEZI|nr:Cyclochlorotine biosynthesis protein O [Colletotrichum spinosum]